MDLDSNNRKDDILVEVLNQQLSDYIKYDKERWEKSDKDDKERWEKSDKDDKERWEKFDLKYEADWKHTKAWRDRADLAIQANTDFIKEFSPWYRRGLVVVGLIVTGTLAIAVKTFWDHVKLLWS